MIAKQIQGKLFTQSKKIYFNEQESYLQFYKTDNCNYQFKLFNDFYSYSSQQIKLFDKGNILINDVKMVENIVYNIVNNNNFNLTKKDDLIKCELKYGDNKSLLYYNLSVDLYKDVICNNKLIYKLIEKVNYFKNNWQLKLKLSFDQKNKNKNLTITNNFLEKKTKNQIHSNIYINVPTNLNTSNPKYNSFKVCLLTDTILFVGVTEKANFKTSSYPGAHMTGYGYCHCGHIYHSKSTADIQNLKTFKKGDIVCTWYNPLTNILKFYVNGQEIWKKQIENKKWKYFCSLYGQNDKIELLTE